MTVSKEGNHRWSKGYIGEGRAQGLGGLPGIFSISGVRKSEHEPGLGVDRLD